LLDTEQALDSLTRSEGARALPGDTTKGLPRAAARRTLLLSSLLTAVVSCGLSAYYLTLTNRSSWFTRSSVAEAMTSPAPGFRLGSIDWDVAAYARDTRLQPFRDEFRKRCGTRLGVEAGICVSSAMAAQFPHGLPPTEFIDRDFDPASHLSLHMSGRPGHCMNRSAIMAGELLSVGIPARVAQLRPTEGPGHTVVEVWDERYAAWVVVDPTYGAVLGDLSGPASAVGMMRAPETARWYTLSDAPPPSSQEEERRNGPEVRLFRGRLLYPEPWLYTRTGSKNAPGPFRGTFACIGNGALECGESHLALRLGIVFSALASITLGASSLRKRRQRLS
jgi:hypothetical protein